MESLRFLILLTVFSPLVGSVLVGLGGKLFSRRWSHRLSIALMVLSTLSTAVLFNRVLFEGLHTYFDLYQWGFSGHFSFTIGFMVDPLSTLMMLLVTVVSTAVHIYSVGYMREEEALADQRFFSYMSLFTFMMLMLVSANNFLQLFFGWEGVGLVSYLLIGFYYSRESAAEGSLKAFLVNRVGDMGLILGIACLLDYVGSLDYHEVFSQAHLMANDTMSIVPHAHWSVLTVACVLIFKARWGSLRKCLCMFGCLRQWKGRRLFPR